MFINTLHNTSPTDRATRANLEGTLQISNILQRRDSQDQSLSFHFNGVTYLTFGH